MAKITFGPIVSEARNKVGGVVYSRNTYGPYSRAFIVPPYTNTSAQAAARAALTALSQRWGSTLTDDQRAGWRSLGEIYPHTDVFHQVNSRPGLQAYLRANLALASVGSSPVDTAPENWHATDPGGITATAVSGAPPTITVNATNPPAIAEAVQIWVTPQQSPGATYFYRRLRLVATAPAGTAGPWDASTGWAARFTGLTFPAKLGVGIRYVNIQTGATGPMRTALITATEGDTDMLRAADFNVPYAATLTLPSAPFTLLPAQGAGIIALPMLVVLFADSTGGAYTNVGDRVFMSVLTGGAQLPSPLFDDPIDSANNWSAFMNSVGKNTACLSQPPNGPFAIDQASYAGFVNGGDPAALANQPITLAIGNYDSPAFNDLGDLTGGNIANTLRGTVYYVLQSV